MSIFAYILVAVTAFFATSCSQMPTTPDDAQCSPIMKTAVDASGVEWISTTESYCLCRTHRFSLDYIGHVPDTEIWREPILSCNKLVGWKPDAYGRKASYWEHVRILIKAQMRGRFKGQTEQKESRE
jgi:hypothetical protein